MKWFYHDKSVEIGPLSETALRELHQCGTFSSTTLIRREDSEDWGTFEDTMASVADTPGSPTIVSEPELSSFYCMHCGQRISAECSQAGMMAICPACSGEVLIPGEHVQPMAVPVTPSRVESAETVAGRARGLRAVIYGTAGRWNKSSMVAALVVVILLAGAFVFFRQRNTSQTLDPPSQGSLESLGSSGEPKADFDLAGNSEAKTDSEKYLIKIKPVIKVAVSQEEIEGRPVNGYYVYFRKGETKPFTGYAKSEGSELWRLMDGVVQEHWQMGGLFPLYLRHAIYRKPKQGESLRMDFDQERGVVSVKVWTPTGERCRDTKVENGKGTEIRYGSRVEGESPDQARPSSMTKYEYGEGTFVFLPAKAEPPQSKSIDLMASEDFDMGFRAGAIGSNLPFTNREAYLEGRQFGKKAKSMPAYTQGYNQGREHGIQKITRRSNPFNKISQKVDWLAWDEGYSIGNMEGQLSR